MEEHKNCLKQLEKQKKKLKRQICELFYTDNEKIEKKRKNRNNKKNYDNKHAKVTRAEFKNIISLLIGK